MIRKRKDMEFKVCDKGCHNGQGKYEFFKVIKGEDSDIINFIHDDFLDPGTSFGIHLHDKEEVYFVLEGNGILTYDDKEYEITAGDVSLIKPGHSHGIKNTGISKLRLVVIGFKKRI